MGVPIARSIERTPVRPRTGDSSNHCVANCKLMRGKPRALGWLLRLALGACALDNAWTLIAGWVGAPKVPTIPYLGLLMVVLWGSWQLNIASPLRARLRYSPEWGYVAFFIPVVNLVLPYLAVRELFLVRTEGSASQRLRWLLPVWWLAFVASFASMLGPFESGRVPALLAPILTIIAALTALMLVRIISFREQIEGPVVDGVSAP